MACTSQSALDYVKHAKPHLISGLKDLSVILENLNQKGVLGDEEVSNIKAEKTDEDKRRTTLISVIKKGEAACYELLKIIDRTRKRTLEKLLLPPEKNSDASTEKNKFDLHHWISCFSFKEETQVDTNYLQGPRSCHKYQEMLKSNAKEKSNEFWAASKNWFEGNKTPDLSYSSLILDTEQSVCPSKIKKLKKRKSKLSRPKKLRTYIPEEKPTISPSELLKTDKNILLVGKPGIGKTALTHEMLRLWAERESKELDYMFYFDMRETAQIVNAKNLEELLFSFYCGPDEGKDAVLQDIQSHSDNVTIIFDGLTDISSPVVTKILKNKLLPLAKIIITCRPDDEDTKFFSGNFDRVEVKGFSEQTIKTYLSATLGEDQTKVLSSVELVTLCHVPMYALMMAVCFSSKDAPQPCTITEIYINIVRYCLQINSRTKNQKLNFFIKTKREEILSLAEAAFLSTQQKTVNLTDLTCDDSCVLSFLKPLLIKEAVTETITTYAFLHYTVQEFFAALWLLKNPDKIRDVFQQCLTEEKKHMKHLIPFMCRLLNEKSPSLMKHLIPDQDLKNTSNWFFKELINTFLPHLCEQEAADTEGSGLHVHILFVCQCLYESQSPEACVYLLDKLDYHLDLSGDSLDPYPCCAVAYVVTQSKERKIRLNLEDVIISEQGMRQLFGCFENVQWSDSLARQLWELFLISEEQMDFVTLLSLDGNHLHLPTQGEKQLYERAVEVIQRMPTKVNVCLYWDNETPPCHSQCESLLKAFPFISSVSFRGPVSWSQEKYHGTLEREQKRLFMDLCLKAALHDGPNFYNVVKTLLPLFPVKTDLDNIFLDLFQYVNSKEFLGDFQGLRPFFQSAPAVWSINLSERKTSILLEVLKLQPEKKQVELTGCSHEESEVRSFLQCLPYISQLRFISRLSDPSEEIRFLGNLICAAAERDQQAGEKILELLSSVCRYKGFPLKDIWCDLLLDLYCYKNKTGLSVLPSLQSVFQSAPAVWSINLSERKTSILLEVLKLQPEKKQGELTGCSHEESEMRSFLQCLPYITELSFKPQASQPSEETRFFVNLFCAAAEREQQTGEKILELLSSMCSYQTFTLKQKWCDLLLDLYPSVLEMGLSVLPPLWSVFKSTPAVWSINLSERKTSILLEVLKLQPEKKQLNLTGWSHEENEGRTFLQCLPYISQLSFSTTSSESSEAVRFFGDLFCAAAEREQQTGEKKLELLSSVCTYKNLPLQEIWCDFLMDLYYYTMKTGLSVLPSLQSVFQSAPAVWSINLSERKTSILLEVLKLQPEKKQVELTGCSHEESEVRSFLQCLPYISQLSVVPLRSRLHEETRFFVNLFCAAAEREQQRGEKILELLSSVCRYKNSPLKENWCDFFMDLYSHVKDYETKTGLSVLPSLQSVFQSAPAVWSINLSERKTSILLEVLKLQPEKKQVELTGCSHEESEVRSFLQCLPYISQLSFFTLWADEAAKFFGNLFCAATEREQQTGEKILELLSSVCRYQTFPFIDRDIDAQYKCNFLLDLCSHVKDYESKTGLSVLPSLQSVFQSAPAVWFINLSERKTSILLEILKVQSGKKQLKLRGCPHEESEVRNFLQCLPYISQLSCDPDFFQSVCTSMSVRSREEAQQLESLLQLLGFQLLLTGELHRKSCWSVGRVLRLCGSKVDLILTPSKMSARGAALLFRHTTQLHSLRLSIDMSLLLFQWVRRGRVVCPLAVEELSLVPKKARPSQRVMLRAVSSLASLLRHWTVGRLDLTESCIPAQGLITLLLHDGPLTVKLSEESFQQLLCLLHEIQDKDLTLSFFSKVGGDLTSCCLNWELLHYLLQQASAQTITVNLRKNLFLQEETTRLLPFLDRIVFKRPSPSFVMSSIRELYRAHDSHAVPSLLRSLGHVINLSSRELDSVDCAALIFILKHGDRVKLNLLWTSIPAEGAESILFMLDNVSHLSVDRNQLLRFIHCCAACDVQQEAASGLLRTLQHSLDLSCSSCVELPEEHQPEPLSLTADDCRAVSTILTHSSQDTQLDLRDCEVEDSVLDLLFPVLHRVRLRVSKTVLLQLLSLVPVNSERDTVRRAVSLCRALGGELDLSHSTLDQRACGSLVQMLDSCEGLTELDLSHCQLTDQLLLPLITHLHKVQVLDLSHNQITDASTDVLLQLLSINPSIDCVRLYSNNIVHRAAFKEHKQCEI
ncbi:uncharacterized protein LOC102290299 isoform X20 [Haplochromis burtoni]|uniref:uncharacterized protein LOC102290299 isoform X19 n=1 Tax=Haplochromis burtoni TaxID=8153 RepID=UPI001C2CDE70|nr:uncharacterized protein LOC102290299 isoform X19 [Haplochromis burtoni]XP_042071200.1 uncharacterized protein LOC102290299 isoform X20 [Haplochromis burtoni]